VNVAVLGLGRMGTAMAVALAGAGHRVTAWNRTPRTVEGAVEVAATVAEAVVNADVAVVMVLDGPAAAAVLDEITGSAPLVVNASTVAPAESMAMADRAAQAGLRYLETPVLGSVPTVRASGLTVLAGGDPADLEAARPVLDVWTSSGRVWHTGPVGTATALKLVANTSLGIAAAGLHDCVRLGADLDLPRDAVLDVIELGSLGGLVQRKRSRLDSDDYADADFTIGALSKDLELGRRATKASLPVLEAAAALAADATARTPDDDLAVLAEGRAR
jgi:3-hydroxyisobutyrate dehydrogenase